MIALIDDCRRQLEEVLDYLGEYWREDLDIDLDDMDKRLEDVNAELFSEEDQLASLFGGTVFEAPSLASGTEHSRT